MNTIKLRIVIRFTLLIVIFQQLNAQNSITLNGIVKNDSIGLENIHIINTSSNFATYSNNLGKFKMKVIVGDTLLFSSVSHANRKIKISENHAKNKFIIVYLEEEVEQLKEVEISQKMQVNYKI